MSLSRTSSPGTPFHRKRDLQLVRPAYLYLASYVEALQQGWSADTLRGTLAAHEELQSIARNAGRFLAALDDPEAKGSPITLPDGSRAPRLPGFRRWLWDGELCGSIGFRWQNGTAELPEYVSGHIGYSVVPWKRRLGYATRALQLLLEDVRQTELPWVVLNTDPENRASQRVIEAAGGVLMERYAKAEVHGGSEGLRYRISLR